ncbi:MAG: ABC transporter permease [Acidobacteria bacterium]|nr:ABC transporter permease [Acidobacteriota bacterium]
MTLPSWWLIGWRNLGRNPRRTFITALGLAAGYFAVIFMVGFADGLKVEMIDNGTGLMTGQIQIHSPRYRPDRSLYETLGGRAGADFEAVIRTAVRDPAVVAAAPRVYGAGLLSSGQSTRGGMLMGIDLDREPGVSRLMNSLWHGRAPSPAANELMIGTEMARRLELQVGDEVILVVPAADGSMGNDIFRVCGLYRTGMADLDGAFALVPIRSLQRLLALDPGRIHEIALATADPWLAPVAGRRLAAALAPLGVEMEVLDWTGLRPEMLEYALLMDSWYSIVVIIVFAIALFGVANTMLMSTFERRREFSVMLALGARPHQILLTVVSEATALGWISLVLGVAVTFPLIAWWHHYPIDLSWIYGDLTMLGALIRPVLRIEYNLPVSLWTGLALLVTAVTAGLYPAARAAWLPPADTLSGL